jgi:hypothetical protein
VRHSYAETSTPTRGQLICRKCSKVGSALLNGSRIQRIGTEKKFK